MRNILDEPKQVDAIELMLKKNADPEMVKARLKQWLGSSFSVKDRYEQNALLHQLLNSEKWLVYIILTFVLVIAIRSEEHPSELHSLMRISNAVFCLQNKRQHTQLNIT